MNVKHLVHSDVNKPFHVFTRASEHGIDGMLAQRDNDGNVRAIAYCSKLFTETQKRWHVSEQELTLPFTV